MFHMPVVFSITKNVSILSKVEKALPFVLASRRWQTSIASNENIGVASASHNRNHKYKFHLD